MAGFRENTVQKVKRGLFDSLKTKASLFEQIATANVKRAFFLFPKPPIDTGATQRTTFAKILFGVDKATIRFKSENKGGYGQFPLLGQSTSSKYGERNWLFGGVKLTAKELFKK